MVVGLKVKKFSGPIDPMYKFKTQQCKFFDQGKCTKGSECPFKHGDDDSAAEGLEQTTTMDDTDDTTQ